MKIPRRACEAWATQRPEVSCLLPSGFGGFLQTQLKTSRTLKSGNLSHAIGSLRGEELQLLVLASVMFFFFWGGGTGLQQPVSFFDPSPHCGWLRNPFRTTLKPWLKPQRVLVFPGKSIHSRVSWVVRMDFAAIHSPIWGSCVCVCVCFFFGGCSFVWGLQPPVHEVFGSKPIGFFGSDHEVLLSTERFDPVACAGALGLRSLANRMCCPRRVSRIRPTFWWRADGGGETRSL